MNYIADLHLHSHYSRATSKNLNLESLYQWARIKGIHVVATGDFTHPQWVQEIKEKLTPDGNGFFLLKNPPDEPGLPGIKTTNIPVRFCLTAEISSIYKFEGRVRKNHNLVFAPDFDTVERLNRRLSEIGNLKSDGRPILGLPARDLLEIVLECSDNAHLIPAHIWTPWFSTLGSKAGYNSIGECFRDLSSHIFAIETGLSSDPAMNRKVSFLDKYTLISNSDAHSPKKLGREATLFDTELSYYSLFHALKTKEGYAGTYEFFPEEGKYHADGHRKCGISLIPHETLKYNKRCPVCGRPLTIGVLHRVEELADRKESLTPAGHSEFDYIIPLPEILSEILGVGPDTKTVSRFYIQLISTFGNEFRLLRDVPKDEISKKANPLIAEAIDRIRNQRVKPVSGYDGEFGKIHVFTAGEMEQFLGQTDIFGGTQIEEMALRKVISRKNNGQNLLPKTDSPKLALHEKQKAAVAAQNNVLVIAGPGTGKTKTLINWVINKIKTGKALPGESAVITFTNKASEELKTRLIEEYGEMASHVFAGTFHSVAYNILRNKYPDRYQTIYDAEARTTVLQLLFPELTNAQVQKISTQFEKQMDLSTSPYSDYECYYQRYIEYLQSAKAIDLAQIIPGAIEIITHGKSDIFEKIKVLAVDELQDINPVQYEFVKLFAKSANVFAIGDPDQCIYGFRGSDLHLFDSFRNDFNPETISLEINYRNTAQIFYPAFDFLHGTEEAKEKSIKCTKQEGSPILHFHAKDAEQECDFIVRKIYDFIGGVDTLSYGKIRTDHNYAYSDIAIIYRTHSIGAFLVERFRNAGIPVQFSDGNNLFDAPPFSQLASIIRLLVNSSDRIAEMKFLTQKLEFSKIQAAEFQSINQNSQELYDDFFFKHPPLKRWWNDWCSFKEIIMPLVQTNSVQGVIQAILDKYFPISALSGTDAARMELLKEYAGRTNDTLEIFMQNILFSPYLQPSKFGEGGVRLLTYHASKGLEFPIVFLPGMEEGITPIYRKDVDMDEERRLFYVAMTRCSGNLLLSWSDKRYIFGQKKSQKRSRFLTETLFSSSKPAKIPQKDKRNDKDIQLSLF